VIVLRDVMRVLTDTVQLNPEDLQTQALTVPGVLHAHQVRTRGLANHIFVDLSIHVDPNLSVEKAHTLAHEVEQALIMKFPGVEDVVVHIEPEGH